MPDTTPQTRSGLPPLREFADRISQIAQQIADAFTTPDDDFHPVMVAFPGDGTGFKTFALPGDLLDQGERGKDALAEKVMVPVIDAFGARMISWTMSAWNLNLSGAKTVEQARAMATEARRIGLANHPDREEIVIINCLDALDWETRVAEIRRTAIGPPSLGPWRDFKRDHPGSETIEGRFVEPIQDALRDSSGVQDGRKIRALRSRGIRMIGF